MAAGEATRGALVGGAPTLPATALWLLFWIVGLGGLLAVLLPGYELVGDGHGRLIGIGAAIGLIAAGGVSWLRRDIWRRETRWGRLKTGFGLAVIGATGGSANAEFLNMARSTSKIVERPVIARWVTDGSRGRVYHRVLTLYTASSVAEDRPSIDRPTWTKASPGLCLLRRRAHGWLGGDWIAEERASRCSAARGSSGDRVIVRTNADGWRWHRSAWGRLTDGQVVDRNLSTGARCRTDRHSLWLYRC